MDLNEMRKKYLQKKLKDQALSTDKSYVQKEQKESYDLTTFEGCLNGANAGNVDAQFALAVRYENGDGVDKDADQTFQWYLRAAIQGHAVAQNALGVLYYNCEQYDRAAAYFEQAVDRGNTNAMNNCGIMYRDGIHYPIDYNKAYELFSKSANLGNTAGLRFLGYLYKDGRGVCKNVTKAIELFEESANQGDHYSSYQLGYMYYAGEDVPISYSSTRYWYEKSSNQGNLEAPRNLGILYEKGTGVCRSLAEALKWYHIAENLGNKQVYMDIRRVQNLLAHRTSFKDDLLQDIATCTHRLGVSGKMSLASAGLLGQRNIELINLLLKEYGISLFSYDICKCRTINDLIIKIGKVSGKQILLPYR